MHFSPCRGRDNCTEGGTHCQGCGRSHEEIAETRQLMDALARFALKMGYDNVQEYAQFIADKTVKKVKKMRS